MQKFLVIQTAFIGDVVLATGLIEKLHAHFPDAQIDFLLRKGNEALLTGHPYLHEVLVWNKKEHKLRNLWTLLRRIRRTKYDKLINVQRFAATGFLTAFSGARETIGFDKNPLSRLFSRRIRHIVSYQPGILAPGAKVAPGKALDFSNAASSLHTTSSRSGSDHPPAHEIDRNQLLIKDCTDSIPAMPHLYPAQKDYDLIREYQHSPYITISPASVWFTKQYPAEKWTGFIKKLSPNYTIFLLGASSDLDLCEKIQQVASMQDLISSEQLLYRQSASPQDPTAPAQLPSGTQSAASPHPIVILAGKLSFLQSLALMQGAAMNYTNDSAPMHFASAGNAPVTAVYCSTIPAFGFGPLSDKRFIVEIGEPLGCRPCGLHGFKACPLGHFKCALLIKDEQLLATLP